MAADGAELLRGQLAYYRRRSGEYDVSLHYDDDRVGRQFGQILDRLQPRGQALELACGTGLWTELLARRVSNLVAVDGAPEMVAIAKRRAFAGPVRFVVADLFDWEPDHNFDTVFFAFWLSHVPPDRFEAFWQLVRRALRPDGRALFVDTGLREARYERFLEGAPVPMVERTLGDGSTHEVMKVLYDEEDLRERLRWVGFHADIWPVESSDAFTDRTFYAGRATPFVI